MITKPVTIEDDRKVDARTPWMELGDSDERRVIELLKILKGSKTGRSILTLAAKKASKKGLTLLDIIKPGEVSITDTTLTRKFSSSDPTKMIFESNSKVYVDRSHRTLDAVLDLSHELIHYIHKGAFNPYRSNFNMVSFVQSTIEGKGGEVEAYLTECQVYKELYPSRMKFNSNCSLVWDEHGHKFSHEEGVKQFYRLGAFREHFVQEVKDLGHRHKAFPVLSQKQANFISSAYGLPYPLAAVREFKAIMTSVCQNDSKRLSLMERNQNRSPASNQNTPVSSGYVKFRQNFVDRCGRFVEL